VKISALYKFLNENLVVIIPIKITKEIPLLTHIIIIIIVIIIIVIIIIKQVQRTGE